MYTEFQDLKNTRVLQLVSLEDFMGALNYTRNGSYFVYQGRPNKSSRALARISFANAVMLHNHCYDFDYDEESGLEHFIRYDWKWEPLEATPFGFMPYDLAHARAAKLVHAVKLQMNSKNRTIKVQSNKVRFVHPQYARVLDTLLSVELQ